MKTAAQLKPNYGPAYAAAMYPGLAVIFHRHGYALAVHGSLARDFDLIAVPWAVDVSAPEAVLKDVTTEYALRLVGETEKRNHGRVAYTLSCGFGECAIDLSFMSVRGTTGPLPDRSVNAPPSDYSTEGFDPDKLRKRHAQAVKLLEQSEDPFYRGLALLKGDAEPEFPPFDETWPDGRSWDSPPWYCGLFGHRSKTELSEQGQWRWIRCTRCGCRGKVDHV